MTIRHAAFPQDSQAVLMIWRDYVASPIANLDYQGNEDEFANLPGKYGAPDGRLLLAEVHGQIAGCVALRKVCGSICEMKKLYVRPSGRGMGLGRLLVEHLIAEARAAGYREMRLDVLAEFTVAQKLYAELGFEPADAVSHNPTPGAKFLGLKLV